MKRVILSLILLIFTPTLRAQQLYPPTAKGEIVSHTYYSLSYIEQYEQAEWVYYILTPDMVSGAVKRKDDFRPDERVSTGSAQLYDYSGSGYDRGHLAPAASMSRDEVSMSESFFMSNMSPQVASFNRGGWKNLEELVRRWVAPNGVLHVVTGVIFGEKMKYIGANRVAVPPYYYKVIYAPSSQQMVGFVMPNKRIDEELQSFMVSVDSVELLSGVDLFYALSDDVEAQMESKVTLSHWDFSQKATPSTPKNTKSTTTQCLGVSKSTGSRCRNQTSAENGYCHIHQPQ